jgi:hypothetical protein
MSLSPQSPHTPHTPQSPRSSRSTAASSPRREHDFEAINRVWAQARGQLKQLREERDIANRSAAASEAALKDEAVARAESEAALAVARAENQRLEAALASANTRYAEALQDTEAELIEANRKFADTELALEEERAMSAVKTAEILEFEATLARHDRIQQLDNTSVVISAERSHHLEVQLEEALGRIETQQTQLAEARALHASILSKLAAFESEIIALRSQDAAAQQHIELFRSQALTNERRAKQAEIEAEKVVQWAHESERKASAAAATLKQRMKEVQAEAAEVLGLQTQAMQSLSEMREKVTQAAQREGQFRSKMKTAESRIAHLTHQLKMSEFNAMAIKFEDKIEGGKAERANAPLRPSPLKSPQKWFEESDRRRSVDHNGDSVSTLDSAWYEETAKFIASTRELLHVGERDFGISPTKLRSRLQ